MSLVNQINVKQIQGALDAWLEVHPNAQESASVSQHLSRLIEAGVPNVSSLLPLLFRLKGKPYTLNNHFPFQPIFDTNFPTSMLLKCARQTGKSASLSTRAVMTTAANSHYNILFVTPLFEMVRRLSSSYVAPLIEESPIGHMLRSKRGRSNVLHRAFNNGSNMYFSYAYLSATRIRGINASEVDFDELQNFDVQFLPEIISTTDGSEHGLVLYAGTPLTMENAVEERWQESSMGEWVIPCRVCRKDNIPSMEYDLDAIIGPYHDDISEHCPATICANPKCRRPIFPRDGFWADRHPELRHQFAGLHIPQMIIPQHYANPNRWQRLLNKQNHQEGFTDAKFYNEICAESYDHGARILTLSELKTAASLPVHSEAQAVDYSRGMMLRGIGVDWGGGGLKGDSLTKFACGGIGHDGVIDIYSGRVSNEPHNHHKEAVLAQVLFSQFDSHVLAHDFAVGGEMRDKFMIDNGFPAQFIMPIWYVPGLKQKILNRVPSKGGRRSYHSLDKPRAITLVCNAIRYGLVRFFPMEGGGATMLKDFLALVEDKSESMSGGDVYRITRTPGRSDDFAHAVTFLCCALWSMAGRWPEFTPKYETAPDLFNGETEYTGYDAFTNV